MQEIIPGSAKKQLLKQLEWTCVVTAGVVSLQVSDMALEDYIAVKPKFARYVPHTAGRYQKKRFRKAQCPIVER